MSSAPTVLKGTIRGTTVELERDSGLPDGQSVTVILQPVPQAQRRLPPGEGIRRSAGGWAEDAEELEKYLEWNRLQRKMGRPEMDS